jgi:hypothetical protein
MMTATLATQICRYGGSFADPVWTIEELLMTVAVPESDNTK